MCLKTHNTTSIPSKNINSTHLPQYNKFKRKNHKNAKKVKTISFIEQ